MTEVTLSGDRAALVARLTDLVKVLDYAELVELRSVVDAMARAHGVVWGQKAAR